MNFMPRGNYSDLGVGLVINRSRVQLPAVRCRVNTWTVCMRVNHFGMYPVT